jgi:hypothetical protein
MSDVTTYTTFDVAKKCPKCNNYGEIVKENPGSVSHPDSKVYTIRCETKLCRWYNTTWIVEVDKDGKVPVRDIGHTQKRFPERKGADVLAEKMLKSIEAEEEVSGRGRELSDE